MVAGSIQERIKKMKQAILMEAKQRALTIVETASEQANQQRAKLYNTQKEKIDISFSLQSKQQKVKAKIEKSSVINRQRIRKMQARHELIEDLRRGVEIALKKIVDNEVRYRQLMRKFIIQGMLRMMERNVAIETKKSHGGFVQGLFEECQNQFTRILENETGRQMESRLVLSEYSLEDKNKGIIGGVFLRSSDGLIVCDNSLDSRVKLIFQQRLPSIREMLFGKTKDVKKGQIIKH